jgi:ATP-dependent protease ClpP protease subunit
MRIKALLTCFVLIACSKSEASQKPYIPLITFETRVTEESVAEVTALLKAAVEAKADSIVLELNTPGGEVDAGFLLTKTIEKSTVPIVCVVDGEADSMGFYILQGCHVRLMTKRSILMQHLIYFGAVPGSLTMPRAKEYTDRLRVENAAAMEHNCRWIKLSKEVCRAKINESWWMSWEEAVKVGAVDGVVDSVKSVRDDLLLSIPG